MVERRAKKAKKNLSPEATPPPPGRAGPNSLYLGSAPAGVRVNEDTAFTLGAVFACVRVISEGLAALPWGVYERRAGGGRTARPEDPADWLCDVQANPETPAFQFRETLLAHALTWGNGYGEIERDGAGRPVWMWQLTPDRVEPERATPDVLRSAGSDLIDTPPGALVYRVQNPTGPPTWLGAQDVFHLRGLGFDGLKGYSVIRLAARSIGVGIAADESAAALYANDSTPGGYLTHKGRLSDQARLNLRKTFQDVHRGPSKRRTVGILEEGMTWQQTGLPPEDAQLLEQRQFTPAEICRWFRVQPHKIADLLRATFCCPFSTEVFTRDGPKPIGEIKEGEEVWSHADGGPKLARVVRSACTGSDEIFRIRTTNRTLRCNARHRVLVRRKVRHGRLVAWESEYVPAGGLRVGDVVVTLDSLPDVDAVTEVGGRRLTEGFMEFCGLLLGDGNVMSGAGSSVSIARAGGASYMGHYREVMLAEFTAGGRESMAGDGHHQAVLTAAQVGEIRALAPRIASVSDLARRFGVNVNTACRMARGGNYEGTHAQAGITGLKLKLFRDALASRLTARQIADRYGVSADAVHNVLAGRSWAGASTSQVRPVRLQEGERQTRFRSVNAVEELTRLGFAGKARTKSVPAWVFRLSRQMRLAFLRGFLDADGSADRAGRIVYNSVNRRMLSQIRHLCISCGIPVTNLRRQAGITTLPNGRRQAFELFGFNCSDPGANRLIGSHDPRYVARLAAGRPFGVKGRAYPEFGGRGFDSPGFGLAKVVEIGREPAEPVYDLTVEGTHSFVAEGVIVHNSNIEQQSIEHVTDTLLPWGKRLETEANVKLFGRTNRGKRFTRLNFNALLRGDTAARSAFYVAMLDRGIFNVNEVRELEDMNPIGPDGDKRFVPLNMQLLEKAGEQPPPPQAPPFGGPPAGGEPPPNGKKPPAEGKPDAGRMRAALMPVVADGCDRVRRRASHGGSDEAVVTYAREALAPVAASLALAGGGPAAAATSALAAFVDDYAARLAADRGAAVCPETLARYVLAACAALESCHVEDAPAK